MIRDSEAGRLGARWEKGHFHFGLWTLDFGFLIFGTKIKLYLYQRVKLHFIPILFMKTEASERYDMLYVIIQISMFCLH